METIGYIGAFLLAICALPQTIMSIIQGHSIGLSHGFLWCWYLGELLMTYFVIKTVGPEGPLFWNYVANSIMLTIIVYYKYFPRGGTTSTNR